MFWKCWKTSRNKRVEDGIEKSMEIFHNNTRFHNKNCLTCERRGLSSQLCFAAREMLSFHRISSRRCPSVCSTLSSRLQCHRVAVGSLRTGFLTTGSLVSGWLSWCLPWRQETIRSYDPDVDVHRQLCDNGVTLSVGPPH